MRIIDPGTLANLLSLAGLGLLVTAAWWLHPSAGLGLAGAILAALGGTLYKILRDREG